MQDTTTSLWETSVGSDPAFLLARANALSLADAAAALASHGLKVRSYSVLALACGDLRPTQRELSEFLRLDPSQVVSLLDDLERRGWVSREPDPRDRRVNVVVATAAGRTACARAREAVEAAQRAHFAVFDDEEFDTFTALLRRLAIGP
ncbi:MarR family winged helix-turn-helix transcriptional regulator [Microbacterium terrisoli]|jgi:DNA-binding MarR family transcriptional regulator|uniref:MarR family winged helix-turn-helix transcriptional regulator n=1 Tax=Microbacterium terrisoli TaxID=3242192 RepID=UPI0028050DC2|nr:MarR family winged helix-turn-helix transcriptional regulator [Microbacterium protaetiae]